MKIQIFLFPLALLGCSAEAQKSNDVGTNETEIVSGPQVLEAARVAFPSGKPIRDADGVSWTFGGHKLLSTNFGFVLISEGQPDETEIGHVTSGRLDITFLEPADSSFYVKKRYPEAVQVGSFGQMSEWAVVNSFRRR
jgi:hypothetical protein